MEPLLAAWVHMALESLRSAALIATSAMSKGQSKTAALCIVLGDFADPGAKLRIDVVMQWLHLASTEANKVQGLATMWQKGLNKLRAKGEHRWSAVRGPMLAVIAVLFDIGWRACE